MIKLEPLTWYAGRDGEDVAAWFVRASGEVLRVKPAALAKRGRMCCYAVEPALVTAYLEQAMPVADHYPPSGFLPCDHVRQELESHGYGAVMLTLDTAKGGDKV